MRLSKGAVGVTRGVAVLFSAFENDGEMWAGDGPRLSRTKVAFSEAFISPPVVHVAISMWDISSSANQRVDISTDKVTEIGFEIVFRTWSDTKVARIRAEWMAIGPVPHEDDWDL